MIAVLLATAAAEDGTPAALLPVEGVAAVAHHAAQLRRCGTSEIHILARPEWTDELAAAMAADDAAVGGDVAGGAAAVTVVPVDSTADALEAVAALLAGAAQLPGRGLVLLGHAEATQSDGLLRALVRDPSLSSGVLSSTGLVAVVGEDRPRVAAVADDLALRPAARAAADDALGLLLPALSAAGLPFAPIDEERLRLISAVKASDGFFTTFFVSPYSKYVARWAARRGLTPNQVTVFSMLLGIAATVAFARGTRPGLVAGAILLQLAFTADCVDGQLARYSLQFSRLGAWLDSVFDRGKEYLVYAGLALGATRAGDDGTVWLLAVAALALQTTRHAMDFSWATMQTPTAAAQPLLQRASPTTWLKRIVVLPIGERFALISITATFWNARVTFLALLVWGGVALAYGVAGRVVRTVRR